MSPNDVFSKKSTKRYRALRKIVRSLPANGACIIIPGRERPTETSPERVYLAVVKPPMGRANRQTKKFYFYSKPNRREVEQIIEHMTSVWRKDYL